MTQWFEEIEIGDIYELGDHTFHHDEIIKFAKLYDPQVFHIDPELAKETEFGELVASGWHTACIGHRKLVDALFEHKSRMEAEGKTSGEPGPSPGLNDMVFKVPVRAGDTITYRFGVDSKRASKSLPGWGLLLEWIEAHNQNGELVYKCDFAGFVKMRDFKPTLKQRIGIIVAKTPILRKMMF